MLRLLDSIIEADARRQKILHLLELLEEAKNTDKEVCGNCDYWMKSSLCPSERNVNGRQKGPSISGLACKKFKLTQWIINLKKERLENINKLSNCKEILDLVKGVGK